ncbi:MAG: hypothetical protein A2086_11375 [Spirochaetes bacterium GWD1_27_9]|nr:MAG: hypothetical protein A2Z98_01605 [Spirochaetes bacterium GWB1_27_13]OHD38143.1 MAG: hypothetical protein A2086_11375 [Spirochaetes bacterium GWD1_27_9]
MKQISIFLENKKGRLAEVTNIMFKSNIDIKALSLADTRDFGVLRIIVNKPDDCLKILKQNNFVAQETEVIAIEVQDKPGGLFKVLEILDKNDVNVEYMYATVEKKHDKAFVIFRIEEKDKAMKILTENNINVAKDNDILNNL